MDGIITILTIIIGSFFLGIITGMSYFAFRCIAKGYFVNGNDKYKVTPFWKHGAENRRREEID